MSTRKGSQLFWKAGAPFLVFMVGGSYLLTGLLTQRKAVEDERVKVKTAREAVNEKKSRPDAIFDLDLEYRKHKKEWETQDESKEGYGVRIQRPKSLESLVEKDN